MANVKDVCEICGYDEFIVEAGFYFCSECGNKLLTHRELVDKDVTIGAAETKTRPVKESERSKDKITSWEQLNHILHRLTEQLIELGATADIKPIVLQIWCSYLRLAEAAFFSKRQRTRPHVSLYNQRNDLKLLFNTDVPKSSWKSRREKVADSSTSRGKRKLIGKLLEEEHDALLLSQSSDPESTLSTLSSSLHSTTVATGRVALRFNSRARKWMKEKLHIDDEHIEWHEHEAPIDASCHSITALHPKNRPCSGHLDNWSNISRKTVIVSILVLALNQVKSPIQKEDILRWINEGHLPFHDLEQLLPDGLDSACYSETIVHLSFSNMVELTAVISLLSKDLGIFPVEPDMIGLCRRYLSELALPSDLEPYIVKLMAIGPKIKPSDQNCFPAYERHAMTYILFIMKLLFGLDEVIETKMDACSMKVNDRLSDVAETHPKLFVWHEWQQYVSMRHTILEQLHYPTNQNRANRRIGSRNGVNGALFLDFAAGNLTPDDDNRTGYKSALTTSYQGEQRRFKNIHSIIATTTDKYKNTNTSSNTHISFEHSLQPQSSYLEEVLRLQGCNQLKIFIPEYMHTNHSKRTVVPFFSPMSLKQHLMNHHGVALRSRSIKPTISHIQMENVRQELTNPSSYLNWIEFSRVLLVDDNNSTCSDSDYSSHETNILDYICAQSKAKMLSHEELLNKVEYRNLLAKLTSDLNASIKDAQKLCAGIDPTDPTIICDEPFTNCNSMKDKTVPIALSNFHYWVRKLPRKISARKFIELGYFNNFPSGFQFLLTEGAYVTNSSLFELYSELNSLETYFLRHVVPN